VLSRPFGEDGGIGHIHAQLVIQDLPAGHPCRTVNRGKHFGQAQIIPSMIIHPVTHLGCLAVKHLNGVHWPRSFDGLGPFLTQFVETLFRRHGGHDKDATQEVFLRPP